MTATDEHGCRGSVTFVAAGPGELSLLALAGAKAIGQAHHVIVDSEEMADELVLTGIETTATVHVAEADEVAQLLAVAADGSRVVRLSSHGLFSRELIDVTLPGVLAEHQVRTNVIPGVSRWGSAITYGAVAPTDTFAVVDATDGLPTEDWPTAGTVIAYTGPDHAADVVARGTEVYGPDSEVLEIRGLGRTTQTSRVTTWGKLAKAGDVDVDVYFVVGPGIGAGTRRRLDWFESKPLFDWSILVPRTKDDLTELCEELAQYGATTEIVPTMSIEPPRTEQAMERAIRGLVDGRYLWCILTSPHAVKAVFERLAEYGLDSRAMSGVSIAAVGRGTVEALSRHGLRPDLTPSDANTVAGLALEFPAHDDLIDPLDRVLIPSADVNVEALVESLGPLGWDVEEVTAYRTVRAAPPPAEMRDRIKMGEFDAVVFPSSTAVRNMIGIAGKPHAASVIAAIGPATAQTCEMHGLRVDVTAATPSFEQLAEDLARFAAERRATRLEEGLADTKPSERRRRKRRKPVAESA